MKEKILPILIIVITILVFGNLVFLDVRYLSQPQELLPTETEPTSQTASTSLSSSPSSSAVSEVCGADCQQLIDEKISQAMATLSGKETAKESKTAEEMTTQKVSQPQVLYIPLGGGGATTSRDWADVGSAEVYLDVNDYPNLEKAYFEGFIKVKYGNGKAFARLYDVTHSIGVQGSDIESASENFTLVESGTLNFWQGKNLYRVQIKSLNGYEASIDSGRIKLILK
jgi:hypothetical protein